MIRHTRTKAPESPKMHFLSRKWKLNSNDRMFLQLHGFVAHGVNRGSHLSGTNVDVQLSRVTCPELGGEFLSFGDELVSRFAAGRELAPGVSLKLRDQIENPWALSKARASWSMRASLKCGPRICIPIGNFSFVVPHGTEMPGIPAKDPVTVYISARYI